VENFRLSISISDFRTQQAVISKNTIRYALCHNVKETEMDARLDTQRFPASFYLLPAVSTRINVSRICAGLLKKSAGTYGL
jgi:hypothetical protein